MPWGAIERRGVSWGHMVNIHTFWCHGVSTIINFVAMGVQTLNIILKDTFDGKKYLKFGAVGCRGLSWGD